MTLAEELRQAIDRLPLEVCENTACPGCADAHRAVADVDALLARVAELEEQARVYVVGTEPEEWRDGRDVLAWMPILGWRPAAYQGEVWVYTLDRLALRVITHVRAMPPPPDDPR